MITVDSCMIWFHFDCIMQLKKSYHIATNVCSRKSATTFGDLPISKQKSLPPFVFLEAIRHIRYFLIDKAFKETLCIP